MKLTGNRIKLCIRAIREAQGISATQIAEGLNIPVQAYREYENGNRICTIETLDAIADYLDCTMDLLLGLTSERAHATLLEMRPKDRMRNLRAARGWTQEEAAERAGISVGSLVNGELYGKRMPSVKICVQLADAYGVSLSYLLGHKEAKK